MLSLSIGFVLGSDFKTAQSRGQEELVLVGVIEGIV